MKTIWMAVAALLSGCVITNHATQPSSLGLSRSSAEMLAIIYQPGTVNVETVNACD